MYQDILVPVDGSEEMDKAIEFAADMAKQGEVTVHLLHVVRQPTSIPSGIEDYMRAEGIRETPNVVYLEFIGNHIMGAAEDAAKQVGIKKVKRAVVTGDPAEEIINYARDHFVDMIVLGTQDLGSVARRICQDSDRTCVIVRRGLLEGKRILVVDDEPDVLETLEESLSMCRVRKAATFEEAKNLLETEPFDLAILDIMGVNGYRLLEVANQRKITAVMLTAHALSPEDTIKSYERGAAYYIPKEKMDQIVLFLNDVLEAKARGKHSWWRWFDRFGAFYGKKFAAYLQEKKPS